jgi:hypothetical protein
MTRAKRTLHLNEQIDALLSRVWERAKGRAENLTLASRADLGRRLLAQALVEYAREIGAIKDD